MIAYDHIYTIPVQCGEGIGASGYAADKRLLFGMDAHVHLEAVGGEKGLFALSHTALELVVTGMSLLMGSQVTLSGV